MYSVSNVLYMSGASTYLAVTTSLHAMTLRLSCWERGSSFFYHHSSGSRLCDVCWLHAVCRQWHQLYTCSTTAPLQNCHFHHHLFAALLFCPDSLTTLTYTAVSWQNTVTWILVKIGITIPCTITIPQLSLDVIWWHFCLPVSEIMSVSKHSNFEIKRLMSSQNAVCIYTVFWLDIITKTRFLAFLQIVFFRLTVFWIFTAV